VFQLADRIVTHARHQTYLVIDENEGRVLGSQGFVGVNLIDHGILHRLLGLLSVALAD
jgi:hypothetical protein